MDTYQLNEYIRDKHPQLYSALIRATYVLLGWAIGLIIIPLLFSDFWSLDLTTGNGVGTVGYLLIAAIPWSVYAYAHVVAKREILAAAAKGG